MIAWLFLLACSPDPHVTPEPALTSVHALLDGTTWDCDWVAVLHSRRLTVPHTWTFHDGGKVSTDLADTLRDEIVQRRVDVEVAQATMHQFLDFRGYGFPYPSQELDFGEVAWHGVGADTLLIQFAVHDDVPAEKWTVVPAGVDAIQLDRDGEDAWAITCRLGPP